jgi:arylsulfatase
VHLSGGPSHQDIFDLKPDAPSEFRGQFQPIATNVGGMDICEHMPQLATMADKFAIIRSLIGSSGQHSNYQTHSGYDQRDLLARKGPNKRREFFYWTDDGNLAGLRYEQWKAVFLEQKAHGFDVWAQPMVQLRLPMLFNLRSDPFERAQHEAGDYVRWFVEHAFVLVPAQSLVAQHLVSFQQFPPRQKPGSFSVEQAMEKLRNPPSSN